MEMTYSINYEFYAGISKIATLCKKSREVTATHLLLSVNYNRVLGLRGQNFAFRKMQNHCLKTTVF